MLNLAESKMGRTWVRTDVRFIYDPNGPECWETTPGAKKLSDHKFENISSRLQVHVFPYKIKLNDAEKNKRCWTMLKDVETTWQRRSLADPPVGPVCLTCPMSWAAPRKSRCRAVASCRFTRAWFNGDYHMEGSIDIINGYIWMELPLRWMVYWGILVLFSRHQNHHFTTAWRKTHHGRYGRMMSISQEQQHSLKAGWDIIYMTSVTYVSLVN